MRYLRPFLIAAALALPAALLRYLYRRPLPKTDGVEAVHGLDRPVEVIRDRWGVPHIYALNEHDLFYAQGFIHAQDRLWQMEFSRRLAHGRLAEILGEPAWEADRLFRTLGLTRAARRDLELTDPDTMAALQAYADGVNCWLRHHATRLPLEFQLLRRAPDPWEPLDTLAFGRVQGWVLSHNWDQEVLNTALIARVGPERAAQLRGDYPPTNPLVLPGQTCVSLAEELLAEFDRARTWLPALRYQGLSNNWVVDGAKSVTGKPLLANDPHLGLDIPGVWYENHLSAPGFEVTGVTFPGVPGVVIGHNERIAWGVTASLPDTQDLYLERFHPDDPTLYQVGDGWERATVHHESVHVRGEATPRLLEVIETRHGPLVTSLLPLADEPDRVALSLRWVGYEPCFLSRSVVALNRAQDWDQFTEALRDFDCPSQNFVYADIEGNIGLYVPGKVPVRPGRLGQVPMPGWTDENEWQGWIPFEELPSAFNPEGHYLASANNKVAGIEYPHLFSCEQYDGVRARRITDLLEAQDRLSAEDFARIQNDVYSLPAESVRCLLLAHAPAILSHPALQDNRPRASQVLALLREWDCELTADSIAATVYELTEYFAAERVFRPWLGDLTERYLGLNLGALFHYSSLQVNNSRHVLRRLLEDDASDWFRDGAGNPLSREDILAQALNDALTYLRQHHGEDIANWKWGNLHRIRFHHTLGRVRPLDRLLNRGPYPLGGDQNTVNAAFFRPQLPLNDYSAGPSWRMILDLSDWDASRAVLPTGQSGHPASPHYDDMIPFWRDGRYHPMLWSRDKIEANAEGRLILKG
ncbi:MAG: penicillin acylase family protein [Anaerolineae bacterium]|jgi:penicillin amidase